MCTGNLIRQAGGQGLVYGVMDAIMARQGRETNFSDRVPANERFTPQQAPAPSEPARPNVRGGTQAERMFGSQAPRRATGSANPLGRGR